MTCTHATYSSSASRTIGRRCKNTDIRSKPPAALSTGDAAKDGAAKTENLVARAGDEIGRVCERMLNPVRSVL